MGMLAVFAARSRSALLTAASMAGRPGQPMTDKLRFVCATSNHGGSGFDYVGCQRRATFSVAGVTSAALQPDYRVASVRHGLPYPPGVQAGDR